LVLPFAFLLFTFTSGCGQRGDLRQAQDFVRQSKGFYQKAVEEYKQLISEGRDLSQLYLQLGRIYYDNGKFAEAKEVFKKSRELEAKKFLALSYYHTGDFTDALEIFNKNTITDAEFLYYHGLTCEKLNLFDQALKIYKKLKGKDFALKAKARIETIEKRVGAGLIKDIDPAVHKILQVAPGLKEYPQAGALILHCDEKVAVSAEGTETTYLHYIIKILNERGKEDFSETQIGYDSTYEKVELEYARTIKPDGSVQDVGKRHIRDVSKYLNFPLYSNARVYIISFPEIVEGATIEYKVKIYRNKLINKKDFVLGYPVQAGEPIISANFTITASVETPLHIKTLNEDYNHFGANLTPETEEEDGLITYNWQFKDIPQIIPESNMPPLVEVNPTILVSTFNQWEEVYDWWWELAKDKSKLDAAIRDKVKELIKDKTSDKEKIRAIYNFCAQKIRYVAVEYGEAGFEPHDAADIFRNKYGDCKDQSVLLIGMLKEAGFPAWPVLIATKERYNLNADLPSMMFNHCIASVGLGDKIFFLDPTAETCPFGDLPIGDQGRRVLIFKEDGFVIKETPFYPPEHNLAKQKLKLKIYKNETVTAQKEVYTFGFYDQAQRYWLLYTQPELIEEMLKEKIQGVSIGADLEDYKIKNVDDLNLPVVLSYAFGGPEYFTSAGNLRIMPQLTGLDTSLVAKDGRKYAIDFEALDSKETALEIEIPDNFVIKYMPDSLIEESPWLEFMAEYKYENNRLYFNQRTEMKKSSVSVDEYPEFKKFFQGLAKKIKQRIVLEKIR